MMVPRKIEKTWCHEHLVLECGWIDGLELKPPNPICCHVEATEEGPLCEEHEKEFTDPIVIV